MPAINDKKHSLRFRIQDHRYVWLSVILLPLIISRIVSHLYYHSNFVSQSLNALRDWPFSLLVYYVIFYMPSYAILGLVANDKKKALSVLGLVSLVLFPAQLLFDFIVDCAFLYKYFCD
jgi:hypothetical protein